MSNIAKAQRMMGEGKSLETISKNLGLSMELLEGLQRDKAAPKKQADKNFMPRSFVKKDFTVLPTQSKTTDISTEDKEEQERSIRKKEEDRKAYETLRLLMKMFPKVLKIKDPHPLVLGIHEAIFERLKDSGITKKEIRKALEKYTGRKQYLQSVVEGGVRYDLEGKSGDAIKEIHIEKAIKKINKLTQRDGAFL